MKFLHMADLHLGIKLYEMSMHEDQKLMLDKAVETALSQNVQAVLISGDVYDKPVPPADAVQLFDRFLTMLSEHGIPVLISSGNHDSAERLSFGSNLMSAKGVYFSPVYNGVLTPVTLEDEYGKTDFWMLPFIKPSTVRRFFENTEINSYTDALSAVINSLPIDRSRRNVLLCHQNIGLPDQCDSQVGGVDMADVSVFEPFDYVALGHIHEHYHIMRKSVRYCGSVLCYDFRFCNLERGFLSVCLDGQRDITADILPFEPLHRMKEISGSLDDLTDISKIRREDTDCYLSITLTDEQEVPDALGRLRAYYPYIMTLKYDNTRTRTERFLALGGDTNEKSPFELFSEFYELRNNSPMSQTQADEVRSIISEVWGDIS